MKNVQKIVGSYAVSTIDVSHWGNAPMTLAPSRTTGASKKTREKAARYPIFGQYATLIQDPFWIQKFENAAMGKFPPKFSYNDGVLYFTRASKRIPLKLPDNPQEGVHKIIEFIQSYGGLFSPLDRELSRESSGKCALSQETRFAWSDVNKKVQECLVNYYIIHQQETLHLTGPEVENLRKTIKLGITNKILNKNNIVIENNRIARIDEIKWDDFNRRFSIRTMSKVLSKKTTSPTAKPKKITKAKKGKNSVPVERRDMVPQFNHKWKKYVTSLLDKNEKLSSGKNPKESGSPGSETEEEEFTGDYF